MAEADAAVEAKVAAVSAGKNAAAVGDQEDPAAAIAPKAAPKKLTEEERAAKMEAKLAAMDPEKAAKIRAALAAKGVKTKDGE